MRMVRVGRPPTNLSVIHVIPLVMVLVVSGGRSCDDDLHVAAIVKLPFESLCC